MLKIRDISLRKRMMLTNFLMVFIPVVWLTILGGVIFAGLQFTGTVRQSELALLWPEKGSSMSISYAVSSLRMKVENEDSLKLEDVFEECLILEKHGIQTVIVADGRLLYITDGANENDIRHLVQMQCGDAASAMSWNNEDFAFIYSSPRRDTVIWAAGQMPFVTMSWNNEDFAFIYSSPRRDTVIWAAGQMPFVTSYDADDALEDVLEIVLFAVLILSIIVIIWLGLYLSRLLSRQIIEPLAELRKAAAEIQQGNFEYPLVVPAQDELGQTCRDFDDMRKELRKVREERQKYEQNRKELIAGISHDLATPLTLLKGYASGIREGIARTPEKQRQYVDKIYDTACAMERLVDSLFLFSKLDLGRIPFSLEVVPIYRYFEDVIGETAMTLAEQGVTLTLQGHKSAAVVAIDRNQFRRVVENLLTNCVKYKTTPKADVEIVIAENGESVVVSFVDHGAGVPAESLPKLFDSFYRTDAARTDVKKGSGLGLAIAKQIIESLHGSIWAEETKGGGLTISMRLPIAKEE